MSDPIPDAPDVVVARALVELVDLLHTDPAARVLVDPGVYGVHAPRFTIYRGGLWLAATKHGSGIEQLAAARALFGSGEVTVEPGYSPDYELHTMRTSWRGVPLDVIVRVSREDELAVLRKEIAERDARAAALVEQRHQLHDAAVPPLAVAGPSLAEITAQASASGAAAL